MLIFGTRQKGDVAGFAPGRCNLCGPTVVGVIQRTKKFTLYFIPVLTYGKDSTALCATCGSECYLREGTVLYSTEYAARAALGKDEAKPRRLASGSVVPPDAPAYLTKAARARLRSPSWMSFEGRTPEEALERAAAWEVSYFAQHGLRVVEAAWLRRSEPTVGLAFGDPSQEYESVFRTGVPIAWESRLDEALEAGDDESPGTDEAEPDSSPETKRCPDCAESVLAEARICRFCRYEFRPALEVA